MLAVFLAATSFAPGAPLRGAVVAPRRAAAPVAFGDFDTLHSVTTQIAELVDADGPSACTARVGAPGWVAPRRCRRHRLLHRSSRCARAPLRPPAQSLLKLTPPPPSTARSARARRPSRACRRPRRAASDRVRRHPGPRRPPPLEWRMRTCCLRFKLTRHHTTLHTRSRPQHVAEVAALEHRPVRGRRPSRAPFSPAPSPRRAARARRPATPSPSPSRSAPPLPLPSHLSPPRRAQPRSSSRLPPREARGRGGRSPP